MKLRELLTTRLYDLSINTEAGCSDPNQVIRIFPSTPWRIDKSPDLIDDIFSPYDSIRAGTSCLFCG